MTRVRETLTVTPYLTYQTTAPTTPASRPPPSSTTAGLNPDAVNNSQPRWLFLHDGAEIKLAAGTDMPVLLIGELI